MKKKQLVAKTILVMKISLYQLLFAALFLNVSYANKVNAQEILKKPLKIELKQATLQQIIPIIQEQTGAKFIYSSKVLDAEKRLNVSIQNKTLADFFEQILKPINIGYKIVDEDRILLFVISQSLNVSNKKQEQALVDDGSKLALPPPDIIITGTVTDEKGNALEGVSVQVKNSTASAVTNKDGKYTIKVKDKKAILIFTSVGFIVSEKGIGASNTINVVLKEAVKDLDDVVLVSVGYGSAKRKDLTGSIGTVAIADLKKAPVASFEDAFGGRMAGVQVTSQSGQPGDGFQISIRGNNSVTQSNGPLYVIDGFPIEGFNNSLINPAEIESMDVLKDASATAIYGARGANGVVLITTKRGKEGPPQINYQGYVGGLKVTKQIELLNPYEFVKLQLDINPIQATTQYLTRSNRTLEDYKSIESNDVQEKVFRHSIMQNHYMNIRGGSANTKYSFSGNYFQQDGVIVNSGYKRYQINASIDQNLSPKLKVGLNLSYTNAAAFGTITAANSQSSADRGAGNTSPTGYLMYNIWGYRPTTGNAVDYLDELLDPDIALGNLVYSVNPYIQVTNELREKKDENNIANIYAEWNPNKYVKFRSTFGFNKVRTTQNNFNNSKTASGNPITSPNGILVNGSVINNTTDNWSNENTVTYNRTFNKIHALTVLAGVTEQGGNTSSGGFRAIQVPNESLGISGLDEGTVSSITSTSSAWTLASFLARVNYGYKSRYLFTVNFRADGSSRFSDDNKWAYFPSGSFAWRFSEEEFIKNALPFLNDGKIRVGYGETGNNRVNDFSYLSVITTSGINNTYSFNNAVPSTSAVSSYLGNKNLKWETTNHSNIGIDLSFLNRRFQFTADAYNKITNDLLINAPVTRNSGYFNILQNVGKVQNYGIEFTLNYKLIDQKDFKWNSSFNISFNRNKVLALAENQEAITFSIGDRIAGGTPVSISKIGYPIGTFYGYLWDGVYQYSDFDKLVNGTYRLKSSITTNGNTAANIQPGDVKYRDLNGDLVINGSDNTIIGNPNPKHYGGFSNNFTYKNFDLNVFFQWSYGNNIANVNRIIFEGGGEFPNNLNQYKTVADRWTPENPTSTMPSFRPSSNGLSNVFSSRTIEDGSYLRLKTVSLAYNLPTKLLKRIKFKNAQLYASAQNLMTWTNYSGSDPEVSVSNNSLAPGIDFSAYPRNRTVTVGLNITF
jgi:TonB-linked SusC/RagA family outer membrane protein